MDYDKVYSLYQSLKENLNVKKQALIKNDIEKLTAADKILLEIAEKIQELGLKDSNNDFSQEQKENLKNLAQEIKNIQENNEMLINHSIGVINSTLSGILNIVQKDKVSYNSQGKNYKGDDISISSIVEEA